MVLIMLQVVNNLDSFAKFKPYSDDDYSVRIDEVSGSSSFIVGSVVHYF